MSKQHIGFVVRALIAALVVVLGIRMFFLSESENGPQGLYEEPEGSGDGTGGDAEGTGGEYVPPRSEVPPPPTAGVDPAARTRDRALGVSLFARFAGADGLVDASEFGAFIDHACPEDDECPDAAMQAEVIEYFDEDGDGRLNASEWETFNTESTQGRGPLGD